MGSVNLAGLVGWAAGTTWIEREGQEVLRTRVAGCVDALLEGLAAMPRVTRHGDAAPGQRTGAVSFHVEGMSPGEVQAGLARHGVMCRAGFHCAPMAHEALGTALEGTVRISFGPFNTLDEVGVILDALRLVQAAG